MLGLFSLFETLLIWLLNHVFDFGSVLFLFLYANYFAFFRCTFCKALSYTFFFTCLLLPRNAYTPARRQALHCELIVDSNCTTPDVARISPSCVFVRNRFNCLPNSSYSFGVLSAAVVPKTVRLLTFSASAVVLAPAFAFVVELWPLSQQPASRLVSILRLPSLQSPWLLQRPDHVERFAAPPVVSVLLLSKRLLDNLHLGLQLGSFLFLCGFPRHLLYRNNLASIWSTRFRLCAYVVVTLVAILAVDISSTMDVYLCSLRSSQSRACCWVFESPISCHTAASDFLVAVVFVSIFFISLTLWELLSGCWCFWDTLSPVQPSELRCVTRLFSALQLLALAITSD